MTTETVDLVFFVASLIICGVIVYILTLLWYSNEHNKQLYSFIGFGLAACLWTLFSAISSVTADQYFVFMYTLHGVTSTVFPYAFLWYVLNLSKSRLANSKVAACIIFAIPILDSIMLGTNPWHRLMFLEYNYPEMPMGPLFWVHAIFAYIATLYGLVAIVIYVLRKVRRTPLMVIAGLSTLLPLGINILLALDLLGTRRDLTSISFFLTFALFFAASYQTGIFNFKAIAMDSIFSSLSDVTIISNSRGKIIDVNNSFKKLFPAFSLKMGETSIDEFALWVSESATECNPENALTDIGDTSKYHDGGEISIKLKDEDDGNKEKELTFALQRDIIYSNSNSDNKNKEKSGRITGSIITFTDVSTYKSMIDEINSQNEELIELTKLAEEASKTKSAFLANMSHEIRTPINAITGMAAIARVTAVSEKTQECLDNIDAASRQLLGLINNILDMSKIEADKMTLAEEPFDLYALIDNTKNIIEIRSKEKNQTLVFDVDENLPKVLIGDDMKLTQILLNLLSNAIKFTPIEGKISLSARLQSTEDEMSALEFKITDSGIGISPEQQARLFKSFQQAEANTSKNYGGTGLGLVLSKSIAELMGGTITIDSELGEGSCFTATVCLKNGDESMLVNHELENEYDFSNIRVLLAEDIEINRQIVVELMAMNEVKVECANDGQEAVDIFNQNPDAFDIIFMDVHMPIMDGYEATKLVRMSNASNAKTIPILAMTANAFSEDVAQCLDVGMNDHIAKPLEISLLLQKMGELLFNT